MRKRLLIRLGLLTCLALAGFALYLWWNLTGVSGISRASVWRIKVGMSIKEVDAIIGVPCGDYHSDTPATPADSFPEGVEHVRQWYADAGSIFVCFDAEGMVTERGYIPDSESVFDRLYQWLGIDLARQKGVYPPPRPIPAPGVLDLAFEKTAGHRVR